MLHLTTHLETLLECSQSSEVTHSSTWMLLRHPWEYTSPQRFRILPRFNQPPRKKHHKHLNILYNSKNFIKQITLVALLSYFSTRYHYIPSSTLSFFTWPIPPPCQKWGEYISGDMKITPKAIQAIHSVESDSALWWAQRGHCYHCEVSQK